MIYGAPEELSVLISCDLKRTKEWKKNKKKKGKAWSNILTWLHPKLSGSPIQLFYFLFFILFFISYSLFQLLSSFQISNTSQKVILMWLISTLLQSVTAQCQKKKIYILYLKEEKMLIYEEEYHIDNNYYCLKPKDNLYKLIQEISHKS